jgi:hypothetical protein
MNPDLWAFEEADPDVGIFGESVVHCCGANPDEDEAAREESLRPSHDGTVVVTTTYTCTACGATRAFDNIYPAEWFEEPRP